VAFHEALQPDFKGYTEKVVANAQALAAGLMEKGLKLVSDGTDNHLLLVDLRPSHPDLSGKDAEHVLEEAGITVNKNTVPGETRSPFVTSGLRIGTPALTTRGMAEEHMGQIAKWIVRVVDNPGDEALVRSVRAEVNGLCEAFPLYEEIGALV
jgi:glycine hydroxymethyltransferase